MKIRPLHDRRDRETRAGKSVKSAGGIVIPGYCDWKKPHFREGRRRRQGPRFLENGEIRPGRPQGRRTGFFSVSYSGTRSEDGRR